MALQHLRSSTADKRPTPAAMSDGQLALNTHTSSPGLFFKDSNGDSVKIGPVHVGTTAPNATPGAGGQAGNSKGEQWLDTSSSRYVFKIWDGTAWRTEDGEFVNASGDTMTGALVMDNQQQVQFRETTANGTNSIALQAPAAVDSDKTITLPDATGTLVLSGTIVNADINASAAIAGTKILPDFGSQTVTTTGVISAALGTAAAPSITFTGDINTGIYRPAADTFGITTAGVERMRFRSDGNIGIGGTGSGLVTLYNQGGITGGTTAYGNFTAGVIQSVVTGSAFVNRTNVSTAAAAFTTTTLYHYSAGLATLGAGSAITNNFGFYAEPGLGTTSAAQVATVYGFRGDIASATGRWNFFAAGTAPNYFAGDVRTNAVVTTRQAPTASNTTGTVATATSLLDGLRTSTPAADITLLVPTGTSMDAAFQALQTNQSFEWSLINLATAASGFDVTVTANTDHTVVGRMVVTGETSGRFLTRKTVTNTFITYRIA